MPRPSSSRRSRLISLRFLLLAVTVTSWAVPLAAQTWSDKNTTLKHAANKNVSGEIVNVYSYRQPSLIEPLLKKFTQRTGIGVRVIFAKKGLVERVKTEGENSPADVLLTVDISRLIHAAETIAQPVRSPVLEKFIPATVRSSDDRWFALTYRARVAYVSRDRVSQDSLSYGALASPDFKGRICMRSGHHPYNNALFASQMAHLGEPEFRTWLTGLKNNLSEKPSGGDRTQVRRIYAGSCDVAIGNTYYMGKMQTNSKKPEQKDWARAVRIIFPDAQGRGTHINVSGMVMAKHAPNRDNALKLMEFLVSAEAQRLYAEVNFEYPVRAGVAPSALVAEWGTLTADQLPLETIAAHRKRVSEIVDEISFNN